jgi:hypothetical protein
MQSHQKLGKEIILMISSLMVIIMMGIIPYNYTEATVGIVGNQNATTPPISPEEIPPKDNQSITLGNATVGIVGNQNATPGNMPPLINPEEVPLKDNQTVMTLQDAVNSLSDSTKNLSAQPTDEPPSTTNTGTTP